MLVSSHQTASKIADPKRLVPRGYSPFSPGVRVALFVIVSIYVCLFTLYPYTNNLHLLIKLGLIFGYRKFYESVVMMGAKNRSGILGLRSHWKVIICIENEKMFVTKLNK